MRSAQKTPHFDRIQSIIYIETSPHQNCFGSQRPNAQQGVGEEKGGCGADLCEPELKELWLPRISAEAEVHGRGNGGSEIFETSLRELNKT